jgi:hypothetical protein
MLILFFVTRLQVAFVLHVIQELLRNCEFLTAGRSFYNRHAFQGISQRNVDKRPRLGKKTRGKATPKTDGTKRARERPNLGTLREGSGWEAAPGWPVRQPPTTLHAGYR